RQIAVEGDLGEPEGELRLAHLLGELGEQHSFLRAFELAGERKEELRRDAVEPDLARDADGAHGVARQETLDVARGRERTRRNLESRGFGSEPLAAELA